MTVLIESLKFVKDRRGTVIMTRDGRRQKLVSFCALDVPMMAQEIDIASWWEQVETELRDIPDLAQHINGLPTIERAGAWGDRDIATIIPIPKGHLAKSHDDLLDEILPSIKEGMVMTLRHEAQLAGPRGIGWSMSADGWR